MNLEDVDILCLQETWLLHLPVADGFKIAFNTAIKGAKGRPMSGLLTLVKLESGIRILSAKNVSAYIQVVEIKLLTQQPRNTDQLTLINVYWQHTAMQAETFLDLVTETISNIKDNGTESKILICGDLNINCLKDDTKSDHANGKEFRDPTISAWLQEMKAWNLKILNGETPGDIPAHFTWKRDQQQSTIDYMFVSERMKQDVARLDIIEMEASDHCMLKPTLKIHRIKEKISYQCTNLAVAPGRNQLKLTQNKLEKLKKITGE
ncbi:exodeoxyribonuclease-like [Ambystoma mexicanum]|uniref:exodeoxyribonuclease-like n=1 Tax=Ambystoma mexicanum TaxID=8296 RepID=UPI0037E7F5E8